MKLMENRVAAVTGAASSRGIGRATARLLAEQGATVAIIDLRAEEAAAAAAERSSAPNIGAMAATWEIAMRRRRPRNASWMISAA